ncbi:hypothetical protein ACFS32_00460 [Novosphingobium pokkalii]|uniref:hypothetical protein n=1 Tax=Novosphingobium pokkalii TaxID=1770194 RepID=UPI00362D808A
MTRTGSGLAGGKMMRDPKAKFAADRLLADELAPDQPAARGAYRPGRRESIQRFPSGASRAATAMNRLQGLPRP